MFINARRPHSFTPQFYSRSEQQEQHIDAIINLRPREAYIRLPNRAQGSILYEMRTLDVNESSIDLQQLREIEETYFRLYFRPQAAIRAEIADRMNSILSHTAQTYNDGITNQMQNVNATITGFPAYAKNNGVSERSAADGDTELLRD